MKLRGSLLKIKIENKKYSTYTLKELTTFI